MRAPQRAEPYSGRARAAGTEWALQRTPAWWFGQGLRSLRKSNRRFGASTARRDILRLDCSPPRPGPARHCHLPGGKSWRRREQEKGNHTPGTGRRRADVEEPVRVRDYGWIDEERKGAGGSSRRWRNPKCTSSNCVYGISPKPNRILNSEC